jgi:hypothetical protein
MSFETLINDSVVVNVNLADTGRAETAEAEFNGLVYGTKALCELNEDFPLFLFGRAHKVLHWHPGETSQGTVWTPRLDGGCEASIILAVVDQPVQRVCLKVKLTRSFSEVGTTHRLEVDYNPTTIMAGNNVHPATIADHTGKAKLYPSSHPKVMRQIYRLGFNLLEDLCQQVSGDSAPLFHPDTRKGIEAGEIHVVRAQWAGYLPTPDVPQFLQLMGILFGHTIAKGTGLMQIADHLGFCAEIFKCSDGLTLSGVLLKKKHGEKPLFSLSLYDKRKRVADMRQGKSLLRPEQETILNNVRFDITAHSEGVLAIVAAAKKSLKRLLKQGIDLGGAWGQAFLANCPKAGVWWLERAIYILSYHSSRGQVARKSFSTWLVPHVLRDMLYLDAITNFSRRELHDLSTLDDKVALAWREIETSNAGSWAKALAEKAGCSEQTVRGRRKTWLAEYSLDIKASYGLYRDILFFGTQSVTDPKDRAAILSALQEKKGKHIVFIWDRSARKLDRQRQASLGRAITSRPLAMEIKVTRPPAPEAGGDLASTVGRLTIK